ncbi:hypothetical protein CF335_g5258 [Tilletia laevis]|nr:hypothetical protein CF335_g5258 [Tilletia laevis]
MATVFWAGDIFGYKIRVPRSCSAGHKMTSAEQEHNDEGKDGKEMVGLQTFLQDAYLRAFGELADAVGGLKSVLGFEVMNEPHRGFVNLHSFDAWDYDTDLHIGYLPLFLQAVALGEGASVGAVTSANCKWVGLFAMTLVGLHGMEDLWEKFGDFRIPVGTYARHWFVRAIALIVMPAIIYMVSFKIHFVLPSHSSPGNSQMSSLFQAGLKGDDFAKNHVEAAYGSKVTSKNMC